MTTDRNLFTDFKENCSKWLKKGTSVVGALGINSLIMGVTIKEWQVEVTSHTLEWSKSTIKSKTFHIQEVHKRLNCHQLLTLLSIALRKSRLRVNLSLHSMRFFIINSDNCFPCNSRLHWGILCLDKNGCEHGEVGWFYLTRSWNRCLSGPVISKKSICLKDNGCDATLMPYFVKNNSFNLSKIIRDLPWLEFTDIYWLDVV